MLSADDRAVRGMQSSTALHARPAREKNNVPLCSTTGFEQLVQTEQQGRALTIELL
jgi:hypothetical protein